MSYRDHVDQAMGAFRSLPLEARRVAEDVAHLLEIRCKARVEMGQFMINFIDVYLDEQPDLNRRARP